MDRQAVLARAAQWFDQGNYQALLARRVALATPSDGGESPASLRVYLDDEIGPALSALGFACEVIDNPVEGAPPMLLARRIEDPTLPTVMTYGHGDVIGGQDTQWRAGLQPWRLVVEGERWFGRGTADNKGQHTATLAALEQVIRARDGRLGYNVVVLLEMGEEVGSPGLREVCRAQATRLKADLFLASDGPRVRAADPTVFLGSRGIVNFALQLRARPRAFHSGNWGGALLNPGTVIANAVASLVDGCGRMRVTGLMPPAIDPAVRAALAGVRIGGDADDPELAQDWGEPGLSAAERLMAWNTIEVLALGCGNPARPVNAIPGEAVAHCQLRFVPGTDWERLQQHVQAHLRAHGFEAVQVRVIAATPATRLDLRNPWVPWTLASIKASTGKDATLVPNLAGSLPNDAFADILGLPTVWIPHSYPACAQHAPNEHLLAPVAREGLLLATGLFWDLGEPGHAPWQDASAAERAATPSTH